MIIIRLDVDLRGWSAWTSAMVNRELPWATAIALTRTAQDARKQLAEDLPSQFTIRTPYVARRLRYVKATPSNRVAYVGHLDEFMRLQAEGGSRPAAASGFVAVPTAALRGSDNRGTTKKSAFPGALVRRGAFTAPTASGSIALYRRTSTGELERLYTLARSAEVRKAWPFAATVSRVAGERFPVRFREAMVKGLARARRRAGQ